MEQPDPHNNNENKNKTKVDLNIENYNLDDILRLFKIPKNFSETHLKQAKQIVLKTHPDKSHLHPDYFLFYSKAYKMLYSIWEYKKSATTEKIDNYNTDYQSVTFQEEEKKELLNEFFQKNKKQFRNTRDFNRWFNREFEKNKLTAEGEAKGYEDWLRADDDPDPILQKQITMANMGEIMEQKKSQIRALVVRQDVQELVSTTSASHVVQDVPSNYDSDLFSSLAYQDLHKAHTQSVIPVTEEDYHAKQKFSSMHEYRNYRAQQDTTPLSEQQAMQYLNNRTRTEDDMATRRAYQLAKEAEIVKKREQDFWAGIQRLKDK